VLGFFGLTGLVGRFLDFGSDWLRFPKLRFKLALYAGMLLGGYRCLAYGRAIFKRCEAEVTESAIVDEDEKAE
jgi:hypothetical protein